MSAEPLRHAVLSSSPAWSATPWDYSSCRFLRFWDDGSGEVVYGYGQTIHAKVKCRWETPSPGVLRLTYLDSPAYQFFEGFTPSDANRVKELSYTLIQEDVEITTSILAQRYKFRWRLDLSESPYPEGLQLPYEVPQVFYGYREPVEEQTAWAGAE